jgi:o-succinylbenzoate---CoA ligase
MDPALLTGDDFWQATEPFSADRFPEELPTTDELLGCVLFETSGSTGSPKWIVISKAALRASAAAVNAHLEVTSSSCWGLALPIHHVGGFGVAVRAFAAGCRFAAYPARWSAGDFTAWIDHAQVTHTSLVPTQVYDLVMARLRPPTGLRAAVVGGGKLDLGIGQAARDLGWPVLASYGMTEAASQIATQSLTELVKPYQTAPLTALPMWQVAVGEDERLRLAGPALFRGSFILDTGKWRYIARSGEFYQTSDRVSLNGGGITLLGRADLLVKVLGELVDPEAIEAELRELSSGYLTAKNFAVIAVPDERQGHRMVPIFETSVDRVRTSQILADYQKNCVGFRRLERPVAVEKLPRSDLGKVLKHSLSANYGKYDNF